MGFKCGIVGLPNVGKSTLFNALTSTGAAEAANYPFCTIEPNVGMIGVPDARLYEVAKLAGSKKILPTQIEFVDIAGLVKGASKGEGLGNRFLSHIREVDAIIYVLRCFEDENITHVEGSVNPIRDLEILETELILSDIISLEKRLPNLEKKAKQDKSILKDIKLIKSILDVLSQGNPARTEYRESDNKEMAMLNLLTTKPALLLCNVDEASVKAGNKYTEIIKQKANQTNTDALLISARIEQEIAGLESTEERQEFLNELELEESGLARLTKQGYDMLELITYFTAGPKEARAWTVKKGSTAPQAAGVIHTDFEKGFIRAETVSYKDYIVSGGEQGAKEAGKMRLEGKEYKVQDGDVIYFRFNV